MRSVSAEQTELYSKAMRLGPTDHTRQAQHARRHAFEHECHGAGKCELLFTFDEHAPDADILAQTGKRLPVG